jgi:hypothetical protein
MVLQMIQTPQRPTKDVAVRLHRRFPCARIDIEAHHDRQKREINVISLVLPNCATGPIDELQVRVPVK